MKFANICIITILFILSPQNITYAQESSSNFINKNKTDFVESTVIINEILASNTTVLPDEDFGLYHDWVELFNITDSLIQLGGYYLTDDSLETTKWQIPDNTELTPNSGIIIWADGEDMSGRELHTNFKLNKDGEWLGLYSPEQKLVDSLLFTEQKRDVSFGKTPEGFKYFGTPTPGKENITWQSDTLLYTETPNFSLNGGFHAGSQTISLSSSELNV